MIGTALFGAALVLGWANSLVHILAPDRPIYTQGSGAAGARVPVRHRVYGAAATGVFLLAVAAWAASPWPRVGALAAILLLFSARTVEIRQRPGDMVVRLGKYAPAAATLLGWLVTATVADALGRPDPNQLGWHGAAGVMAAMYVLAAITKLRETG